MTEQGELFGELGGLFAEVATLPTTPIDQLSLPREVAPGVIVQPEGARPACPSCGDTYDPRATWVRRGDRACYPCQAGLTTADDRRAYYEGRDASATSGPGPRIVDVPQTSLF